MLCKQYRVPALHMDTVQFLPGWEIRAETDKQNIVRSFLDSNPDGWVIDGNYSKLSFERRAAEADIIIQMLFGRISCLLRCVRRYATGISSFGSSIPKKRSSSKINGSLTHICKRGIIDHVIGKSLGAKEEKRGNRPLFRFAEKIENIFCNPPNITRNKRTI